MAHPVGMYDTYTLVGGREDLADAIYDISPMDTPFLSAIARVEATAVTHEWQRDVLADAATNAVIEGDDATFAAPTPTERLKNVCQISQKTCAVTGTTDAISKAGRDDELGYLLARKSRELKRDMEFNLTQVGAYHLGSSASARTFAALETWFQTNNQYPANGKEAASTAGQPTADAAVSDGTVRGLTESMMKTAIRQAWGTGGTPTLVMVGGFNKTVVSGFTGSSTRVDKGEDKRLVAAIDYYVSDFGTVQVVPNRFSRARTLFAIDPEMWAVAYLREFEVNEIARTGDAEKRQLVVEYTLESRNERGSALVGDLSTT